MNNIIPITDLQSPDLTVYACLNENQLKHYYEPAPGLFIAESPKVITRALDAGYEAHSFLIESKQMNTETMDILQRCPNIPVYAADSEVLTGLTGFHLTRGMLCAMGRRTLPEASDLCKDATRIVILENVMNPTNMGAIFRSAAALNMDAILLTDGCCDPLYRRAIRVSMGTVFQIPWTYLESPKEPWTTRVLPQLQQLGFKTASMALCEDSVSIDYPDLMQEKKLAIILGTEGDGLSADTIAASDYTVRIPMSHGVDSLNVAAASAVAFWQLGKH